MKQNTTSGFSRREYFAAQAALLCGLAAPAGLARAAAQPAGLQIGIATLGFADRSNAALAQELAGAGIRLIQLFLSQTDSKFWKYNDRTDVSSLTPARCREIAAPYRDAGITIHSLGVYTNLIHPDEAERQANLAFFAAMMEVGGHMGVHTFITEAGHFHDPKAPAPAVPLEFQDAVWPRMVATGKQLAELAAQHDAKVLFEPFYRGFLASAKRLRLFLEAVESPRVRALLDAANLIEVNDLEEMFHQLAPWIDCIHAKDRKLHTDRGVAAGKGDLNYKEFVTLAARHTPHAPLVLEYVGAADYQPALAHLRGAMKEAGIAEVSSPAKGK
jgi:sugar phosphate isomerase/epimerase